MNGDNLDGTQTTKLQSSSRDETTQGLESTGGSPVRMSGPLGVSQDFGSRYHIIRVLGTGGMGAVYEALDRELGVPVALKVVRIDAGTDPGTTHDLERRFKRELLLARQVTHKNVVRIHDLGEIDGIKYLTMPYLKGADLSTVLGQSGKLSVTVALRIARQIVSGLRAAHEAGVIHRDLKPANIMIDAEHNAIIMDFGIAQSNAAPAHETASGRVAASLDGWSTSSGGIIGTLRFMAPEQARGEPVDHRADIYAFGLILRDMLVGRSTDQNAYEEMNHRIDHGLPPARSIDLAIPEALDDIMTRCLCRDTARRYQTTAELAADVERLDDNGVPLPVVRRAISWASPKASAGPAERAAVSVLIADFDNPSGDPVFEGSVEHALTLSLEQARYITVFKSKDARAIAAQWSGEPGCRVTEAIGTRIAQREGLAVLVAGTISQLPHGYRVDLRATEPATGQPIAMLGQEVGQKEQVLSAVAALAARVREALGESASEMSETEAAEIVSAVSLESMRAYAHAQELTMAHKIQGALDEYQRAVALEPSFGRAYAGMAVIYSNYFKEMDKADASYKEAFKHLDRMTEREKYRTLGTYYLNVARNYRKAVENYETLARLYPADDGAHGNLALASVLMGDIPRAQQEVRKSLELYPRNSLQRYNYAMYSMYATDFATAVAESVRLHEDNPAFEYAFLPMAVSHLALGHAAASEESYDRMSKQSAFGASFATLGRADTHLYFGRCRAAIALLTTGIEDDAKRNDAGAMAQKYVALAEGWMKLSDVSQAGEAAAKAIALFRHESTLFPAARVLVCAGRAEEATQVVSDLTKMLQRHTTAYARLITGELAATRGLVAEAIDAFQEAQSRHDSWFSRFLLGRAYVEAGHYAEALAELDVCAARRGETSDAFFFDMPTLRYLPPLYHWLGRAQEGVGVTAQARESYGRFLQLRAQGDPDTLVTDAQARMPVLSS